jgi:rRNA processing protein Krr1/Pno1
VNLQEGIEIGYEAHRDEEVDAMVEALDKLPIVVERIAGVEGSRIKAMDACGLITLNLYGCRISEIGDAVNVRASDDYMTSAIHGTQQYHFYNN